MARYIGTPLFTGSIDGICIYHMWNRYFVRTKSSLTGERVKKDPAFRRTRQKAAMLSRASAIASGIYRALPVHWRQFWMYRAFTGEAMHLLGENKSAEEVRHWLWNTYVKLWEERKQQVVENNTDRIKSTKRTVIKPGYLYTLIKDKLHKQGIITVTRYQRVKIVFNSTQWTTPVFALPP